MLGDADIAVVADVLADRSRSRILLALADGRALPASRLAAEAGVAASTASGHLGRLVGAGMVVAEPRGRHRYYQLAGPHIGELLEAIAQVAPPLTVRSLREGTKAAAVRRARTCYDHLAGRLGVAIMAALVACGALDGGEGQPEPVGLLQSSRGRSYLLTDSGRALLEGIGIDCTPTRSRPLVRYCVDWSEQRPHLAGALGSRVLSRFEELRWIERRPASRAVTLTDAGDRGLRSALGLDLTGLMTAPAA